MPRNMVIRTNLTNQMRLVSDYQRNKKELPVHRHKEPDAGSHEALLERLLSLLSAGDQMPRDSLKQRFCYNDLLPHKIVLSRLNPDATRVSSSPLE